MQTVTLEANEFAIFQLLDLIERMGNAVKFHKTADEVDSIAVAQYSEKLNDYRTQLAELMSNYGLKLIPETA
jgi:molecular chaperone GrpE (heat shock protein)